MMRVYGMFVAAMALAIAPAAALGQNVEMRVTYDGLEGDLAGLIEGALSADAPVVLIHPGSGPTDRDGNSPLGVQAATYRLLAEGLAERGIASVRIDKRGMYESADAVPDPNAGSVEAYVADIHAWTDAIRERSGAPCVWLLGHSEGALHSMAAAAARPEGVCGLLLVAAPGRNLAVIIREQIAAAPGTGPLMEQVDSVLARITAGEPVPAEEIHPGLRAIFAPAVQPFLTSLFNADPARLLAAHDLPVLILTGREDIQTTEADAQALAEARPDARLVLLEGVNHPLKSVPEGDRAANIATYANPDLPLAPGVVETIADFVLE